MVFPRLRRRAARFIWCEDRRELLRVLSARPGGDNALAGRPEWRLGSRADRAASLRRNCLPERNFRRRPVYRRARILQNDVSDAEPREIVALRLQQLVLGIRRNRRGDGTPRVGISGVADLRERRETLHGHRRRLADHALEGLQRRTMGRAERAFLADERGRGGDKIARLPPRNLAETAAYDAPRADRGDIRVADSGGRNCARPDASLHARGGRRGHLAYRLMGLRADKARFLYLRPFRKQPIEGLGAFLRPLEDERGDCTRALRDDSEERGKRRSTRLQHGRTSCRRDSSGAESRRRHERTEF